MFIKFRPGFAVLAMAIMPVSACVQQASDDVPRPAETGQAAATPAIPAEPAPISPPGPDNGAAQPGDLPPCPGINTAIRRPAGSNCLGAVPQDCGADNAMKFMGQQATAEVRQELEGYAVSYLRVYQTGDALIQNLDYRRLNVELDASGTIVAIDCF